MTLFPALHALARFVLPALSLAAALASAPAAASDPYRVIVLDSAEAQLTMIDPATHKVVGTMPTGKEPHHLMLTPDHGSLIVANSISNSLLFVDPRTGQLQRKLENVDDPYQLGFSPDRKWFVTAALRLNRVDIYHYDGQNFTIAKRIPLSKTPSHLNFTSDSKMVFVTLQDSDELAAIDLPTQTLAWRMPVGKAPAGLWMTPNDSYLLVGMTGADYVAVVDWRKHEVVKRIPAGRAAHNFRSLNDGRHVAVSNRVSNTISLIDYQTLTKTQDITGLMPGPDDMELTADGRYLWVTFRFARNVGVIDMNTYKLIDTIQVGRSPHGIYFADRAPTIGPNAN